MDSWLINEIWKPDRRIYVDMHTRYSEQEIKSIKQHRDDVEIIDFPLGQWEREDKIIPLRNLYLPMVICNITGDEDVDICIGATAGDRVLDKSKEFVEKANDILNYLYQPQWWIPEGKKVRVNIDYKDCTKEDLLKLYLDQGGDLDTAYNESFSCYEPDEEGNECWCKNGMCKPCFRKFVAFETMGYKFPEDVIKSVITSVNEEIIPQIEAGTYGRPDEEPYIVSCVEKYKDYIVK